MGDGVSEVEQNSERGSELLSVVMGRKEKKFTGA